MNNIDNQNSDLLWVKQDDEGNITDWEMTFKAADLIKVLPSTINELKQSGKQTSAKECEELLHYLLKQEKSKHKKK